MTKRNVVVYVSNNCSQCEQVVSKLKDWNIDYVEKDVSESKEHFKELQQQKIYGTPATFIDDEKILGFRKRKLQKELGIYEVISFE